MNKASSVPHTSRPPAVSVVRKVREISLSDAFRWIIDQTGVVTFAPDRYGQSAPGCGDVESAWIAYAGLGSGCAAARQYLSVVLSASDNVPTIVVPDLELST